MSSRQTAAPRTAIDGAHFDDLLADLEHALQGLRGLLEPDASLWARGKPGKWSAGQHADHLAICMADTADALERRLPALCDGSLAPVPRRGLLARLWVGVVLGRGWLPRGGRTPRRLEATAAPDRAATLGRIRREAERHRALGQKLDAGQRDRLWAPNPFLPRWHYTLPEFVRVHAVHVRHHAKQIAEITAGT